MGVGVRQPIAPFPTATGEGSKDTRTHRHTHLERRRGEEPPALKAEQPVHPHLHLLAQHPARLPTHPPTQRGRVGSASRPPPPVCVAGRLGDQAALTLGAGPGPPRRGHPDESCGIREAAPLPLGVAAAAISTAFEYSRPGAVPARHNGTAIEGRPCRSVHDADRGHRSRAALAKESSLRHHNDMCPFSKFRARRGGGGAEAD